MKHVIKIFLTTVVFLFGFSTSASSLQYAVIIDAGSSGSRAYVFQYAKSLPMIPIPVIKSLYSKSTQPGLSSYATTPDLAGASLQPILTAAANFLQNMGVNLSTVPVSVSATAGMRSLPLDEQQPIYASVRSYIRDNYAFSLRDQDVRTITGTEEGLYGWLDVNYLLGNFVHPTPTVGSLDMGGASTQIAFATSDTSQPENEVVITLNHKTYRVFSISFLGLGQTQALDTMAAYGESPACFPTGYPYDSETGAFNFDGCSAIYADIIQNNDVAQRILSTAGQKFIAYSGYFYNFEFFGVLQTPAQSALLSSINAICTLSWSNLQLTYPDIPVQYLANFCANGVYFNDLLYTTYQLQGSQLRVVDDINGTAIEWPLGELLDSLVRVF